MLEKYEAPEVEFVEMEDDVVVSSCGNPNGYDDYSYGQCKP